MKSELIVDVTPGDVSIALLEDSRLMSLQKEARNIAYAVGDIYLAKVKKLMPGLNAAFVNVGYEKDAFLHYLDLGPQFASYSAFLQQLLGSDRRRVPALERMKLKGDIDKHGQITEQLESGRELLVQIVKEPISSKGPRLTTELSFTGRYMVLIPFSDKVSVSQKIKSAEEKARLRQLISSIKPKNFGVIVRTSAEGKRVAELNNELATLKKCWEDACAKAQKQTAPSLVFEEESRIVGMLRDVFNPSFEAIHVNDADTYNTISNYVSLIAPDRKDIVQLYSRPEPIFDTFSVTRQIKSSFGKTVSFKSGAYIIIEHTEALHVIDVNSGNRTRANQDQEANALEVNLRAADEIARQLRLRDMGGIIVVDFIDMNRSEHRQELYEHMKEIMAQDRARHNVLPLSKFGLMQITRQRVRPALDLPVAETCPSCLGTGEVQPSLLFTDTLREKLEYAIGDLGLTDFRMYVHPYVAAYLKKGWLMSEERKWRRTLGGGFRIYPDESMAYLQYRIVDKNGNEVDVKEAKDTNSASIEKSRNKAVSRGTQTEDIIAASEALADAPTPPKPKKKKKKAKPAPASVETAPATAPAPSERPARQGKPERADKPERAEKAERQDKPAAAPKKTPRPAQPASQDKPAQDKPAQDKPAQDNPAQDKPALPAVQPQALPQALPMAAAGPAPKADAKAAPVKPAPEGAEDAPQAAPRADEAAADKGADTEAQPKPARRRRSRPRGRSLSEAAPAPGEV